MADEIANPNTDTDTDTSMLQDPSTLSVEAPESSQGIDSSTLPLEVPDPYRKFSIPVDLQAPMTDEQIARLKQESQEKGINPKDLIGAKKVPLGLIPFNALLELALALQDGAVKYNAFNWRDIPVQGQTYLEACLGHVIAVLDGSDVDPVSKVHHLGHAMACAAIYLDAMKCGTLIDNRPTLGKRGQGLFNRDPSLSISHTIHKFQNPNHQHHSQKEPN